MEMECVRNSAVDPFVVVKSDDTKNLIRILESRLPRSASMYNTAIMLQKVNLSVKMYTLNGDLSSNCWILGIVTRKDYGKDISISPPPDAAISDEVKSAFTTTNVLDWDSPYLFAGIDDAIVPMIVEISSVIKGKTTVIHPNYKYYMDRTQATELNIELPNDLELKTLNSEVGVDFLLKSWKHALDGTKNYIEQTVQNCASVGVFKDNNPISGMMLNSNGLLGMLYTANEFRGKGVAQLCFKSLAKSVAKNGLIPTSSANRSNHASVAFHEKVGMKISHKCCFVTYVGEPKW